VIGANVDHEARLEAMLAQGIQIHPVVGIVADAVQETAYRQWQRSANDFWPSARVHRLMLGLPWLIANVSSGGCSTPRPQEDVCRARRV